jgi:hypothetical protein
LWTYRQFPQVDALSVVACRHQLGTQCELLGDRPIPDLPATAVAGRRRIKDLGMTAIASGPRAATRAAAAGLNAREQASGYYLK